jgi:hypothetical protein
MLAQHIRANLRSFQVDLPYNQSVSETQILTIVIAFSVPFMAVLVGVLLNNNRLSDVKEVLSARVEGVSVKVDTCASKVEVAELRTELKTEIAGLRTDLKTDISELRVLIERNHSELMLRMADFDHRISRVEDRNPR